MRIGFGCVLAAVAAAGLASAMLAPAAYAQPPAATAPDAARAMRGFWRFRDFRAGVTRAGLIPLTPKYEAQIQEINRIAAAGGDVPSPSKTCTPFGVPFGMEFLNEILFADDYVMMVLGGQGNPPRHIWTDGRQHTPASELFASFDGESVGRWDGGDLLVDTIGLRPENNIVLGVPVPNMHVAERFHLNSPDEMEVTTTITSPEGLTRPWVLKRVYVRDHPKTLVESVCDPSRDRSVDHVTGKQGFDLTPPAGGWTPPGNEPAAPQRRP